MKPSALPSQAPAENTASTASVAPSKAQDTKPAGDTSTTATTILHPRQVAPTNINTRPIRDAHKSTPPPASKPLDPPSRAADNADDSHDREPADVNDSHDEPRKTKKTPRKLRQARDSENFDGYDDDADSQREPGSDGPDDISEDQP